MASTSFRDGMSSLGWSRRDQPGNNPPTTATTNKQTGVYGTLQKLNPFSSDDHVRLPVHENEAPGAPLPARTRREEEEGWFALSRWDRLLIFGGLNLAAVAMFAVAFFMMPILAFKPNKFAILWSMGSALFLASWAVLMGPLIYLRHLTSQERLPFTATYFGSIALTLFFAIGLHNTPLTLITCIVQLVALVWYLVSYFPMGSQGLRFAARFGGSRLTAWMND